MFGMNKFLLADFHVARAYRRDGRARDVSTRIAESNAADVMVTIWNEDSVADSLALARELHSWPACLLYPEADKIGKQLKYADSIKIPFVCILGDEEVKGTKLSENHETALKKKFLKIRSLL
jgi:histidyl-tRNA synthetase